MVLRTLINITALTLALLSGLFSFRNVTSRTLGAPSNSQCTNPPKRKEWRALSSKEQQSYISAVVCLANTPSTVNDAGTIHDDFAWLHMQIGARVHFAAPFFPWHRMFLHLFEKRLQTACGFGGTLPYWDWTLDWEDLVGAPVWSTTHGFGGDGDQTVNGPFDDGSHCVTDGPFRDVQLRYLNSSTSPHCLSRGFLNYADKSDGMIDGDHLKPSVVEDILGKPHYDFMRHKSEYWLHNAIHWGLRGDFAQWSSANDPIFYLHHAQIDRVWWLWQRERWQRQTEYHGIVSKDSQEAASLDDELNFLDLGPKVPVSAAMQVSQGDLCYTY